MNQPISLQHLRALMLKDAPRWKVRTLKAMNGSIEAWNFLDPKAVETAIKAVRQNIPPDVVVPKFLTRAERKAVKKLLNARAASEDVSPV